jgi:hypothetical protein
MVMHHVGIGLVRKIVMMLMLIMSTMICITNGAVLHDRVESVRNSNSNYYELFEVVIILPPH